MFSLSTVSTDIWDGPIGSSSSSSFLNRAPVILNPPPPLATSSNLPNYLQTRNLEFHPPSTQSNHPLRPLEQFVSILSPSCASLSNTLGASRSSSRASSPRRATSVGPPTFSNQSDAEHQSEDIDSESGRSKRFHHAIVGESRLKIQFISWGEIGRYPQRFGRGGCWIPHGLKGTNEMYDQAWRFEIYHESDRILAEATESSVVPVTYKIINMTSRTVVSLTETPQQALVRDHSGRTITNRVLRMALDQRATEIEASLPALEAESTSKFNHVSNLARLLRPKRCTVGLLFFGLLHEQVQSRMENEFKLVRSGESAAAASSSSANNTTDDRADQTEGSGSKRSRLDKTLGCGTHTGWTIYNAYS